jgi:hypothetical protein
LTARSYELYLLRRQKWSVWLPMAILLVMPLMFGVAFQHMPKSPGSPFPWYFPFPFPLGVLWLVGFGYAWAVTGTPYRITVDARGFLEFKSIRKAEHVDVRDILSIGPTTTRFVQVPFGQYRLTHHSGSIRFLGQFNDQHVLLTELAQANPNIVLEGC